MCVYVCVCVCVCRLEAQLEEALAQRDPAHKPAIDIDTPADKALKLLDKLMRGYEVHKTHMSHVIIQCTKTICILKLMGG